MNLYKFLLISDNLIYDNNFFDEGVTNTLGKTISMPGNNINQFYTGSKFPDLIFMSFKYPNFNDIETAYTIIDKNMIDIITNDIQHKNYHWNSNHDTEGSKQPDLKAGKQLLDALQATGSYHEKQLSIEMVPKHKSRTGGYLTSGSYRFHEYIWEKSNKSTLGYIHHKGHTFDNRMKFLDTIKPLEHPQIHKVWEPKHNITRGKSIITNDYDDLQNIFFDYPPISEMTGKHVKDTVSGILTIKNKQELESFLSHITSDEYLNLGTSAHFLYKYD